MLEKLGNYFSLGFEAPSSSPDVPLMLGGKRPRRSQTLLWELACWLLVTCGVFLRKALVLTNLAWVGGNLTPGAFAASAVIALATFGPFMKWFSTRRPIGSLEHLATAFAFGFFLDLAGLAAHKINLHWGG